MNLHRQISAITHIKLICQKYKVLTPLDFLGVDIHALLTKGGDLRLARGKAPNVEADLFAAITPTLTPTLFDELKMEHSVTFRVEYFHGSATHHITPTHAIEVRTKLEAT